MTRLLLYLVLLLASGIAIGGSASLADDSQITQQFTFLEQSGGNESSSGDEPEDFVVWWTTEFPEVTRQSVVIYDYTSLLKKRLTAHYAIRAPPIS